MPSAKDEPSRELTANDCPLLPDKEAAANRYNQLIRSLEALIQATADLPGFEKTIREAQEQLKELRSKMIRSHYRVGFLGTTGAGKSTTFNNLLRVTAENAPAKSGGGEATTAAPARLRRVNPPAVEPSVRLDFMTYDEYERRRKRLTSRLGLDVVLSEEALLEKCRGLRERLAANDLMKVQAPDVVALESLIRSYKRFPHLVRNGERFCKKGNYAERSSYLNHTFDPKVKIPEPEASERRLLWEVAIDFPNEIMPNNLEMVDLPGLGATSYHDTCVTLDIIENKGEEGLDGAIIFLRADQLSDDSVTEIITTLQSAWGRRFNGRVWMVFNKFDSLAEAHYVNTPNFFSSVDKLITNANIPNDCVFVTCNELLTKFKPEMTPEQRVEISGHRLKYQLTDEPLVRHFKSYPYFEPIIRDLYMSGGLDRLRDAISTRLGGEISKEVNADVTSRIIELESLLQQALRSAERRRKQSKEDVERAAQCAKTVNKMILQVRAGLDELRKAATSVRDGLNTVVGKYATVDDLDELPKDDVHKNFQTIAHRLDLDLPERVVNEGVDPAYQQLTKTFSPLPELPLAGADTIQKAWANVVALDTNTENWKQDLPKFNHADLINQVCNMANKITGPQFKVLLNEQIHVVTLVSMFRVRERLLFRLTELSEELKLLINQP